MKEEFDALFAEHQKLLGELQAMRGVKRTWVGLTDDELKHIEETTTCLENESWLRNLTRNLEAKLKEKNT